MKIGLIGLPNVGKKTLFKLLTENAADPEKLRKGPVPGVLSIRDDRFDKLVEMYDPRKKVPATVEILLMPNLEKQSEKNDSLFRNMQDADVICCLIRDFKDDSIFHIDGSVDPNRDIDSFLQELIFHDLLFIDKRMERINKDKSGKDKARNEAEKKLLAGMKSHLENEKPLRLYEITREDELLISSYPFLSRKEVILVLNVDEDQISDDETLEEMRNKFSGFDLKFIKISVKIEEELSELESDEERTEFLNDLNIKVPAIERLTKLAYASLGLISFFTVGKDEVRSWMVKKDSSAPKAARAIHKDFEKGFIRAEVIAYDDLIEIGSEAKVKEAGKLMVKGKDYIVQDGDILHFLFNL